MRLANGRGAIRAHFARQNGWSFPWFAGNASHEVVNQWAEQKEQRKPAQQNKSEYGSLRETRSAQHLDFARHVGRNLPCPCGNVRQVGFASRPTDPDLRRHDRSTHYKIRAVL